MYKEYLERNSSEFSMTNGSSRFDTVKILLCSWNIEIRRSEIFLEMTKLCWKLIKQFDENGHFRDRILWHKRESRKITTRTNDELYILIEVLLWLTYKMNHVQTIVKNWSSLLSEQDFHKEVLLIQILMKFFISIVS